MQKERTNELVTPPSTRSFLSSVPLSARMLSRMARVCNREEDESDQHRLGEHMKNWRGERREDEPDTKQLPESLDRCGPSRYTCSDR
jgi:hypothetical protein